MSLSVVGGLLGLNGLSEILGGETSLASLLMAIGGFGIVLGVIYDRISTGDSSESAPDARVVRLALLGAVLAVAGTLLETI
ncbi:hypothetical protein [Saliphagus sp. LR7]|uniref:hypothetical protein n=1 Tax=Saliphagus sp. LR7 TaxID=2282654 RepID=UPI0013002FC4|nr:hypothetical protein [Saliphagus sp. LR7]